MDTGFKAEQEVIRRGLLRANAAAVIIVLVVIVLALAAIAAAFRAESHGAGPCLNPDNPISGSGTFTAMPIRKWPIS